MSLLSSNLSNRITYLKSFIKSPKIPGSHDADTCIRGKLGITMMKLKRSDHGDENINKLLKDLHSILKISYSIEIFLTEYDKYLLLLSNKQKRISKSQLYMFWNRLNDTPTLSDKNWNMWGSYQQFISGKCVIDAINSYYDYILHPVWGCLLNPTGGIPGEGNKQIVLNPWDNYITLHSCIHDAAGYLYNYHNIGPGYNYLGSWKTLFPTSSPYSGQFSGLLFWKSVLC